jgi:hypothetical protein
MAQRFGLTELSNYMLYNFHDAPSDLYARMALNVSLNEELGIRIWSFPMRYQPTDLPERSHIGEHWSRYQLRSMQLILQATHGVVSGAPAFFRRAFGDSVEAFEELLLRPHHYIFNREWFERLRGRAEFEEYRKAFRKLSQSQRVELLNLLSSCEPRNIKSLASKVADSQLKRILPHYVGLSKTREEEIWAAQKVAPRETVLEVPDDERVEDAGLNEPALLKRERSIALAGAV